MSMLEFKKKKTLNIRFLYNIYKLYSYLWIHLHAKFLQLKSNFSVFQPEVGLKGSILFYFYFYGSGFS